MKIEVRFKSTAFNCTEAKDYFINPCCFGDDVCRWMIEKLRERGIETSDEPDQEDFGWYFRFRRVVDLPHLFIIGFQPNDPDNGDQWLGWIERDTHFLASLLGRRNKGVHHETIQWLDDVLTSPSEINDVSWHEQGQGE